MMKNTLKNLAIEKPLYYLSHPYLCCGVKEENIEKTLLIALKLLYKGYTIINPLDIVARITTNETRAMEKYKSLLYSCDRLILSGEWDHEGSKCLRELEWARDNQKSIYIYRNDELTKVI